MQKQTNKKHGNSIKLYMIKHVRITGRGNEISMDSLPDRGRCTMLLVFLNGIVSGRTLDNLGVSTQRYFEYIWHVVRITLRYNSSSEKRKIFGATNVLVYIVYSVFDHRSPQQNALDCCWLERTRCV